MKSRPAFLLPLLGIGILVALIITLYQSKTVVPPEMVDSPGGSSNQSADRANDMPETILELSSDEENIAPSKGISPPPPERAGGAIAERWSSETEYSQVFHRHSGSTPVRVERVLRWDNDGDFWEVIRENEMAANRILIQLKSDSPFNPAESHEFARRMPLTPEGWICYEFEYDSSVDRLGNLLVELSKQGFRVEPDYLVKACDLYSTDPLFQQGKQPYMDPTVSFFEGSLNAATLWGTQTDASAAIVAILDSGIHLSHEEFDGQLWLNEAEIPGNGIDDDGNGRADDLHGYNFVDMNGSLWDDHGHGTHLAGLIGASGDNGVGMAGVAWRSSLMPVKVLNSTGAGFVSDVVAGIYYAINNGADVMLLAWQTGADSSLLRNALQSAQDAGLVWSVPAGNSSKALDEFPQYPAVYRFPNQITVASHDLEGTLSNFSNYGISYVEVSAPGGDLLSTGNAGDNAYERRTGTSLSSALVAGLLAHLKSAHPTDPGWRLVQRVRQSATDRLRENYFIHTGNRDYVSSGRVNLASPALLAVDSAPANDNLKDARRFQRPSFSQTEIMLDATAQADEPAHGGSPAECTVWYEWNPQVAGTASIRTDHPAASLAVYRSSNWSVLVEPVASAAASAEGAALEYQANPHVIYYCVVNLPSDTTEPVRTDFRLIPANPDVANAMVLSGDSFLPPQAALASGGAGEPANEVWYRWIAPRDGKLKLRAKAEMNARLSVYEIDGMGDLGERVGFVDLPGSGTRGKTGNFSLTEAQEYAFRWESLSGGTGYVECSGIFKTAPLDVYISRNHTYSQQDELGKGPVYQQWGTPFEIRSSVYKGTRPFSYQWYKDGELLENSGWRLYKPTVDFSDEGTYHLVVSNEFGSVTSNTLEITVRGLLPEVRITPSVVHTSEGASSSFHAEVRDSRGTPVTLEWFLNGERLQGPSSLRVLEIENLTVADSGVLRASATNRFGTTWSQEVLITVSENPLVGWKRILPNTPGLDLISATSAGSRYFVTASGPSLLSSADGKNWVEAVFDGSLDSIGGIAYGNETFMAVGEKGGRPVILLSDDGILWETVYEADGGTYPFSGLTFGNGRFVTLRNVNWSTSTMYSSTDGLTWETGELSAKVYRAPIFGNGIFLISRNGTHFVSSDGLAWTSHAIAPDGPTRTGSLTYHDGFFYKISEPSFGEMGLYRSTDGIAWEIIAGPGRLGLFDDTDGLYYDGEYFMVPSIRGFAYSATGSQFLRHSGNETGDSSNGHLIDIALLGEELIGIDEVGRILHGETLSDLTFDEPVFTKDIHRMEALESVLVAMGSNNRSPDTPAGIVWTRDGVSWEINETPRMKDIAEWRNGFYAIGAPNSNTGPTSLIVSSDLTQWSFGTPLPDQGDLIEAGNGRLIVALEDRKITASVDGHNWSVPKWIADQTSEINELRFLNGFFWLASDSSLHRSSDGEDWTEVISQGIKDITYVDGKYLAIPEQSGEILESTDGTNWTMVPLGGNLTAARIKTDGNSVYGIRYASLLFSRNLSEWISIALPARASDVACFNGAIFFSGDDGLVYRHGSPVAAPTLSADIGKILRAEPIDVSSTLQFEYTAESWTGSVTVSLFVDGERVDQSSDGRPLTWTPDTSGRHSIQMRAEDANGLKIWTNSVEIHVKGPERLHVSNPVGLEATGLISKDNSAWITMARGELFYRADPDAKWINLDAGEAVDGFNGAYKDDDGRLYAYGWVHDAFGVWRGIILRSDEGEVWERFGELLPHPVVDVLLQEEGEEGDVEATFYAITLDPSLNTNSASSGFHYRRGNPEWEQVSGVDTLREIIDWNGRLYAKDRSGNVLVSDDGVEWELEFDSENFDTRENRLEATDEILLLNGKSRVYYIRASGNSWDHMSSGRTLIIDGSVYTESYHGLFELTPAGLLESTVRFETFYPGPSMGYPVQVEWGDGWSLWLTDEGKIMASTTNGAGSGLEHDDFAESPFFVIEGLPFRRVNGDSIAPLDAPEGWSSATLATLVAEVEVRTIVFSDTTTLLVAEDGLYRHDAPGDTWTLIRSTGDLWALAYSQGRFWLGGNGTFEYSDDGGNTWISAYDDLYSLIGKSLLITQIIAEGDRVAVNAINRSILFSADGGASWINTNRSAHRIAFNPTALVLVDGSTFALAIKEEGQEFFQDYRFPYSASDYLWHGGVEYLLLGNYNTGPLWQREAGEDWEVVEFSGPRSTTSSSDFLVASGSEVFWVSASGISQIISHNYQTSLILNVSEDLGVGDNFDATFRIHNQGERPSPERSFSVKAFLQSSASVSPSEALPIGSYRVDLPSLAEGESHDLSLELRLPDFVSPGKYFLRLAGIGMRDARSEDNTAVSENAFINIPMRVVNIEVKGRGSVTILDSRSEYPDKFALPIQVNPDPGYVYSFAGEGSGEVNATGLQTLILDQSFVGSVYFEPSFETWAANEIPSSESRSRSGVAYGGLQNVFKYLFGYDPTDIGQHPPLSINKNVDSGNLSIIYHVLRGRENESQRLMISEDLESWSILPTKKTPDGDQMRYDASAPSDYMNRAFFKLEAN